MLIPKRVKYRKMHRGRRTGIATRGATVAFGDYGLQAVEACWMSNRQIEAARRAMTRHVKRGGQIWIRVFPDKSITKKPADGLRQRQPGRLGRRRQARSHPLRDGRRPGRGRQRGDEARRLEAPNQDTFRELRIGDHWSVEMKVDDLRELEEDQLADRMKTARRELYELRFKHAVGQLENSSQISKVRHDIARIMTVLSDRQLGLVTFVPHEAAS